MTPKARIVYTLLLALPGLVPAPAQTVTWQEGDLRFSHISVEDGLPHGTVKCIIQDRQGFMWFGSHGLCKYDGRRIEVFKPRIDDPGAMLFDVRVIVEGRDGMLWVGTAEAGLARFDPITEQFKVFQYDQDDPTTLSDRSITAILEDRDGILWVGTSWHGLNRFDPKTEVITRYPFNRQDHTGLLGRSVKGICQDAGGMLWVTTVRGVSQFDPSTGQFRHFWDEPDATEGGGLRGITSALWDDQEKDLLVTGTLGTSKPWRLH